MKVINPMKTNTVQARNNIAKESPSSQAQTPSAPQGQSPAPAKTYSLSLLEWDGTGDKELGGITISEDDMIALCKNAENSNSFAGLLKIALAAALRAMPDKTEQESAMLQSNALLTLLSETMAYENSDGGSFTRNGRSSESLLAGLQNLVWETQRRAAQSLYGPGHPVE